jgi:hypothetical protein
VTAHDIVQGEEAIRGPISRLAIEADDLMASYFDADHDHLSLVDVGSLWKTLTGAILKDTV